jgi:hypothetical protein
MRSKDLSNLLSLGRVQSDRTDDAPFARLQGRRRYNRLYVRLWYANPAHFAQDSEKQQQWQYDRTIREAREKLLEFTNNCGERVCGFCRARLPITEVPGLRVCEEKRSGCLETRIPYCGEC